MHFDIYCFLIDGQDDNIEYIPSNRLDGVLLVYNGYTYSNTSSSKSRWYCSKKSKGCKAKIITTEDRQFIKSIGGHAHPQPTLFRSADGKIYKV